MTRFSKDLKDKADAIKRQLKDSQWNRSIEGNLRREIALTLEQIHQLQHGYYQQCRDIADDECYVGTLLLDIKHRTSQYSFSRFPEEVKHQKHLLTLRAERRQLSLQFQDKLHTLEDKLLDLLNKHDQIKLPHNGHLKNCRKT